ncbi:uncharacterized protein LOC119450477 [Dermacentor silvarum]|uniref:uncharacterized protein LOC119450477 n=1 Tax=Dermacentor silvarum TaxID=543639 RepID=UPI002100EE3E|nr:uncharacterized protein LOC119450477 [Dermacentor silvarum]
MLLGGDCKLSASSSRSGDDDGTSSGDSSSSSGSSSDSGSSDVAQAAASQSVDIEDVPTTPSAKLVDSSIAAGAVGREQQMALWIQSNVVRPADVPSDHPDEVHDWSGWPLFPPNKNAHQKRAIVPSLPTKVPHVTLLNKYEFLLPKMEPLIYTQGRLMQPAPSFRCTNLVDDLQYTVWLSFMDATGGECVGQYTHPDSPHPGSSWNGRVLSFSRLKLYSNDCFTTKPPPITLKCNNSYRIQVNVGIVDNSGHILSSSVVRQFVGACFVAVTHFSIKSS